MAVTVATFVSAPVFEKDIDDGVTVAVGELLYFDTSTQEWKKADATDPATYGTHVAIEAGVGGQSTGTIKATKRCILTDTDAPWTAGAAAYLSATAGAITETRPTQAGDLIQRIGQAFSKSSLEVEIRSPYEVGATGHEVLMEGGGARLLVDTDGPASGFTFAAATDDITFAFPIPDNAVGIAAAWLNMSCNVTLDTSDTLSYAISSSHDGEDNEAVTDSISAVGQAITQYQTGRKDLSGGLDVAGIVKPSGILHIKITKAAEGASGDDMIIYPPLIQWLCV